MATATKVMSFEICCPYCGDEDSTVKIDLNDLTACSCSSCDVEFSPAEAVKRLTNELERWKRIETWINTAPVAD